MLKKKFLFLVVLFCSVFTLKAQVPAEKSLPDFDNDYSEAVRFLSSYIRFESITGQELEAGRHFARYCEEAGLHMRYFSTDTASYNFAATLYPLSEDKPVVWFQHHIDVVPASEEEVWEYKPFSGTVKNDTIYGRGVIDAKGLGVMQLMALLDFKKAYAEEELEFNVGLLCLSGEEYNGELGARYVLDNFLEELKPAVVFGEGGAGLQNVLQSDPKRKVFGVSVAEKSVLWLKLDLELVSFGHGATPAPSYANKVMINALSRLNKRKLDLEFNRTNKRMFRRLGRAEGGMRGFLIRHMNWHIFRPLVKNYIKNDPLLEALTTNTITVTKITNPPGPPNKISATSTAFLDCRLQPGVNKDVFLRRLEKILDDPRIEIKVVSREKGSKVTNPDRYFDAMEKAILEEEPASVVIPMLFPATSDNSLFRAYNIPTYGLIPTTMGMAGIQSVHNVNERLPVVSLHQGIRIYNNLLHELVEERVRVKYRKESFLQNLETLR